MSRMDEGFKLYQKGNVSLEHADEEFLIFNVKSKKRVYEVTYDLKEGTWICNLCQDFHYRLPRAIGSFLCKHILAAIFQLADIKGVGDQVALDVVLPGSGRLGEETK